MNGKSENGLWLTGFFTTKKKNPNEPDLRVYTRNQNDELEEYCSMWCKVSKNGNKYLSGKYDGEWITGFIRKSDNDKVPYVSVYFQDDESKNNDGYMDITDEELPF